MSSKLKLGVVVVALFIMIVNCEETLQSLINTIKNPTTSPDQKKTAYQALEKRASGEYPVKEMLKRDVMNSLYAPLREEYGNALEKEQALSVLSKMAMNSNEACDNIFNSGILQHFERLIRRGSVDVQLHIITIIRQLVQPAKTRSPVLATPGILEGIVFALKTGIPLTKEKTAALVAQLITLPDIKEKLVALEVVPYLQKISADGMSTPTAKKHAVSVLNKLGEIVPPEALSLNQKTPQATTTTTTTTTNNDGTTTTTRTFTLGTEGFEVGINVGDIMIDSDEDISATWWKKSPNMKKHKLAQNNYKLTSPSRFSRH